MPSTETLLTASCNQGALQRLQLSSCLHSAVDTATQPGISHGVQPAGLPGVCLSCDSQPLVHCCIATAGTLMAAPSLHVSYTCHSSDSMTSQQLPARTHRRPCGKLLALACQ
jgi:hypothetical protein